MRQIGKGWAWEIEEGLCHWAEPAPYRLRRRGQPSDEAKMRQVTIIKSTDYNRMVRRLKEIDGTGRQPGEEAR